MSRHTLWITKSKRLAEARRIGAPISIEWFANGGYSIAAIWLASGGWVQIHACGSYENALLAMQDLRGAINLEIASRKEREDS